MNSTVLDSSSRPFCSTHFFGTITLIFLVNTSGLKSFAPEASRQLMEGVERRLDYVLIAGIADERQQGSRFLGGIEQQSR